ncbi:MAG: AtpZ/AtpI family protein [Dehalococcoidia bacterium]|nr:AtpZ/AtpI family protein [Dehalococcoidia bacterium]
MGRWADVLTFVGIGWYIAVCILLGVLGGRWIGQRLDGPGTELAFTLIGLLFGLFLAFWGVYRILKTLMSRKNDQGK